MTGGERARRPDRREHASLAVLACALVLPLAAAGCGAALRRYPLAEPVWVDPDMEPFSPQPEEWYSPWLWDAADNSVVRPLAEVWWLELDRESVNVNAVDEVPDSSWFTNRLSRGPRSPEEVALGACTEGDEAVVPPFTITRGKPDGSSRGFFVRDAAGRVYLMKPDPTAQPERAAAAETIAAAIFHAAGYFAPCNRVALVRRSDFEIAPGAELRSTRGWRRPLTDEDVQAVLDDAFVTEDGLLRFSLSQFVEGDPIAPWTYQSTWSADPNDVIPHEHRRDLRAMYVLSAWLNHVDSRQENTLATWMAVEGAGGGGEAGGYVRHYLIDFADSLGVLHDWDRLARRLGHSGYFDLEHIVEDFLTLGLVRRPWDDAALGTGGTTLGYFDAAHFVPDAWRPGYPNHAYEHMTERDAAWMARIVARFSDAHLSALVARGRLSDAAVARELEETLAARRDLVLERWLTRLSPLGLPVVEGGGRVCAEDLALTSGLRSAETRHYRGRLAVDGATPIDVGVELDGGRACAELRRTAGASLERPAYLVLDLAARTEGRETTGPLRVHLYDVGHRVVLVGVERPERGTELPR